MRLMDHTSSACGVCPLFEFCKRFCNTTVVIWRWMSEHSRGQPVAYLTSLFRTCKMAQFCCLFILVLCFHAAEFSNRSQKSENRRSLHIASHLRDELSSFRTLTVDLKNELKRQDIPSYLRNVAQGKNRRKRDSPTNENKPSSTTVRNASFCFSSWYTFLFSPPPSPPGFFLTMRKLFGRTPVFVCHQLIDSTGFRDTSPTGQFTNTYFGVGFTDHNWRQFTNTFGDSSLTIF